MVGRSVLLAAGVWCLVTARLGPQQPSPAERPSAADLAALQELAKPGEVHARLGELAGSWDVRMLGPTGPRSADRRGTGSATRILGGRFLVIDFSLGSEAEAMSYRYTIGFDRRHEEYSIVVMDTLGTYFVTARGKAVDGQIRMFGVDDDPMMKRMGFTKKFAFDLELAQDEQDEFAVQVWFVDTRTKEEPLLPSGRYVFRRRKG